jgi:two-component sensor histidine kinase
MAEAHDDAERLAVLEADNTRLRRLLDEAGAPDGLRHGLRDTMAMLRAVLRLSAETAESVESYATHLEGRLDAISRVRVTANTFGEVSLHTLLSDELMIHLVREGEQAEIAGPALRLRPKAAQLLALAVHELASNAVEHGVLGLPHGRVEARWSVERARDAVADRALVVLLWKESGASKLRASARRGFGMQVLEEMLRYELNATVALDFEPDGLRCTLSFPLVPRIGHVATDAEAEDGADLT